MKTNMRQVLSAIIVLAVTGGGVAVAQQVSERERERMHQAQLRAEDARRALEEAVQMLQEQESAEARRRLDEAIRNLERARSGLAEDRFRGVLAGTTGAIALGTRRAPQMGVFLNTARSPETDSIGAELTGVTRHGPAWEAGLREGDIITQANGESLAQTSRYGISPSSKLIRIKDDLEEGDTLHVQYRRGSETRSADVVVGYLDAFATAFGNYNTQLFATPEIRVLPDVVAEGLTLATTFRSRALLGWLDMELIPLDEELGWYFGTNEGLLIVRAPDDEELDLRSGDVILDIDGRPPEDQAHLIRILRSYEAGETMHITIMRMKQTQTIDVTVPERDSGLTWRWERF